MSKKILRKLGTTFVTMECPWEIISLDVLKSLPRLCRSEVKKVSLENKELKTVPVEIGKMTQLRELNLEQNNLTKIPANLGNLSQLQTLNLDMNRLTAVPANLGNLSQLQTLNLGGNPLEILPASVCDKLERGTLIDIDFQKFCKKYKK